MYEVRLYSHAPVGKLTEATETKLTVYSYDAANFLSFALRNTAESICVQIINLSNGKLEFEWVKTLGGWRN